MAGMEFEYDEQGGTFYYFLLSFLALLLFPATYYLWPRTKTEDDSSARKKLCQCEPCQKKSIYLENTKPWDSLKYIAIKVILIVGWVFFVWVAYKASQVELDLEEFDPFTVLEIDRGATDQEIKKAYRTLSKIYHPDRETGDPKKFMRISKAYAALTDDEARENWEKYGNPDGPGATHFGIALPKWIVEKQNSIWVLAVYGLVFMIILPAVVGSWWYRSIKYSAEQILMDTMNLYRYFIHKTPNMIMKRTIMILGASFEYEKSHNSEIVCRPSDNEEIPQLMRDLPNLQEKNKEPPLCSPYSVKARALLHAHFSRLPLPPKTLEIDQQYVILKAPFLLNEMINITAMLVAISHARNAMRIPRLDTVENMMKLSQMVVQAVWDNKCSLFQLPHISEDMLRHFVTKRRNIRTIRDLVKMKNEERRLMLRYLLDEEYDNIMKVCASMPNITMTVSPLVLDDENSSLFTANAVVTVKVLLERQNMSVLFDKESYTLLSESAEVEEVRPDLSEEEEGAGEGEEGEAAGDKAEPQQESPQKKTKRIWEVNKKKKGGKGAKKKKPQQNQKMPQKPVANTVTNAGDAASVDSAESTPKSSKKSKASGSSKRAEEDGGSSGAESGSEGGDSEGESGVEMGDEEDGESDDFERMQQKAKKTLLDPKSKETHLVHAPYFPAKKYEWWWLYICDKKAHKLISVPLYICTLKDKEEFQLKFTAPPKPGKYRYNVVLRSDSYFQDFDQIQNFEIDVKEEKKEESHPQWEELSEEEDKDADDVTDSDDETDEESE